MRTSSRLATKKLYLKRTIIKKFLLSALIVFQTSAWASHVPLDQKSDEGQEFVTRIFYIDQNLTTLLEISAANQLENQQYRSILLGQYYRFHENLRAGVFYKRQTGFRHDKDWVTDPVIEWRWKNTNNRAENLAIFDISPKVLLSFLPGDWSFDLKTRFEHNFFNDHQNLRLIPTLTYYWIRKSKPFLNFYVQQEEAYPLNYDSVSPNEKWTYLGILYSLNSNWQFGVSSSEKVLSWKSTADFKRTFGETYTTKNTEASLGLLLIYRMEK